VVTNKSGPALRDVAGSSFKAVLGRDPARAAAFAKEFGLEKSYANLDELLADKEIDAVYIATPVDSHASYAVAAAASGKHVLVEKPMAFSHPDGLAMVRAAAEGNVLLGVAYYRRAWPVIQRVRELLAHKAIGNVLQVRAQVAAKRAPASATSGDWRTEIHKAIGGSLADMGSHRIDLLYYLFGPIHRVHALTDAGHNLRAEDSATVLLSFVSGVQAALSVTWNATSPCDIIDIIGDQGRILIDPLEEGVLCLERPGVAPEVEEFGEVRPTHHDIVTDFVAAINEKRDPICSGIESVAVNAILLAAYESARTGRSIAPIGSN